MSYQSSFYDYLGAHLDEDGLSLGAWVLCSASNLEYLERQLALIPTEPTAHLLAYQLHLLRRHAERCIGASCGPSDLNGASLCSDSVAPGPGVRISSSRHLSALISGKSVISLLLCIVVFQLRTSPDSFIPSRIADLITMYRIHIASAKASISSEIQNIASRVSSNSRAFMFIIFPFFVGFRSWHAYF